MKFLTKLLLCGLALALLAGEASAFGRRGCGGCGQAAPAVQSSGGCGQSGGGLFSRLAARWSSRTVDGGCEAVGQQTQSAQAFFAPVPPADPYGALAVSHTTVYQPPVAAAPVGNLGYEPIRLSAPLPTTMQFGSCPNGQCGQPTTLFRRR